MSSLRSPRGEGSCRPSCPSSFLCVAFSLWPLPQGPEATTSASLLSINIFVLGACEDLSPSLFSVYPVSACLRAWCVWDWEELRQGGAGLAAAGAAGQWDKGLEHGGVSWLGPPSDAAWRSPSFSLDIPSVQGCTRRPQRVNFSGTFCLTICVASEAFGCIALFLSLPSLV